MCYVRVGDGMLRECVGGVWGLVKSKKTNFNQLVVFISLYIKDGIPLTQYS